MGPQRNWRNQEGRKRNQLRIGATILTGCCNRVSDIVFDSPKHVGIEGVSKQSDTLTEPPYPSGTENLGMMYNREFMTEKQLQFS